MAEHHWQNGGPKTTPFEHFMSSLNGHKRIEELMARRTSGRTSMASGPCVHNGCNQTGYDLTEGLCSTHYVVDVLADLEDALYESNTNWLATCEAESNAKTIWRCLCGFTGNHEALDNHLISHDGDANHGPYQGHRVVSPQQSQVVSSQQSSSKNGRKRVTPITSSPEDLT